MDQHPFFSVANISRVQRQASSLLERETGVPTEYTDDEALAAAMVEVMQHPDLGAYIHGNTTASDLQVLNDAVVQRITEPMLEPETAGQYWHHNALYATQREGKRKEKTGLVHLADHSIAREWARQRNARARATQEAYMHVPERFAGTVPRMSHDMTLRDL